MPLVCICNAVTVRHVKAVIGDCVERLQLSAVSGQAHVTRYQLHCHYPSPFPFLSLESVIEFQKVILLSEIVDATFLFQASITNLTRAQVEAVILQDLCGLRRGGGITAVVAGHVLVAPDRPKATNLKLRPLSTTT